MAVLVTLWSPRLLGALSCSERNGMSLYVYVCLRVRVCMCNVSAYMCEREAPGYCNRVHMLGFCVARRALGHLGSHVYTHTHTRTQSTCCFLYGNQSCQLPDRPTLQYDWLICSDMSVSQS